MQNPITFLATQSTASASPQQKNNLNASESASGSFKQILSKEISENRNTPKDKSASNLENKTIPQDAKKNVSSQPAKIDPIDEDQDKKDVIPEQGDQANGVQLIALVESLAQFSQIKSDETAAPTQSEVPTIGDNKIASTVGPTQSDVPTIGDNKIVASVDKAIEKFPLGAQGTIAPPQINDMLQVDAASLSLPTGLSLLGNLKVDPKLAKTSDTIVPSPVDRKAVLENNANVATNISPNLELKNDAKVSTAVEPTVALKSEPIVTPTIDPKVALKSDAFVANTPDPKATLSDDVKTLFALDPKTSLREDLKTGAAVESTSNSKIELKITSSTDLKTEFKSDLKIETQAEKKGEFNVDAKQDLKTDLKTDSKIDLKLNVKADPKIQETVNVKEQNLKVTENAPAAQNFAQQIAVSSAQISSAGEVTHLAPRVGSPAWNQSVGQKIVWMVAGGEQTAELTLNPPDLGPMQVVLSVNNDQANATFISAHPDVRDALESAMPKLRQMMNDAGVQLSGFSVKSDASNPGAQFTGDRSSSQSKNVATSKISDTNTVSATTSSVKRTSGNGIVDTFA